jgi:hypothetical protein
MSGFDFLANGASHFIDDARIGLGKFDLAAQSSHLSQEIALGANLRSKLIQLRQRCAIVIGPGIRVSEQLLKLASHQVQSIHGGLVRTFPLELLPQGLQFRSQPFGPRASTKMWLTTSIHP